MYNYLAKFYDELVEFDYDQLVNIIIRKVPKNSKVLDLACGTGKLINLLKKDYQFIGCDLSEEMLEIAKDNNCEIDFFIHDLKDDFYVENLDAIFCTVDSINYLLEEKKIENLFKNVSNNLIEGYFVFDIHTKSKLKKFENYSYFKIDDDYTVLWNSEINGNLIEHFLTFFVKEKDFYLRFDEHHKQLVHELSYIENLIEKNNFTFSSYDLEDRKVYICQKKKKSSI